MGPHIAVLSPPINICGSDCEISVKKLKLNPTANGTNPNGSMLDIAGIINEKGNVLGMMPHPERMAEERLGGSDGVMIFKNLINSCLRSVM